MKKRQGFTQRFEISEFRPPAHGLKNSNSVERFLRTRGY